MQHDLLADNTSFTPVNAINLSVAKTKKKFKEIIIFFPMQLGFSPIPQNFTHRTKMIHWKDLPKQSASLQITSTFASKGQVTKLVDMSNAYLVIQD